MADTNIRGAGSLHDRLENLSAPMDALEKAVAKETRRVRNSAVALCPVNHGELRQSIMTMTERTGDGVRGICYTNKQYAAYVEFGTGPKGEESHEGISPNVQPTYAQKGWWFPGDGIPPADADRYHWWKSTDENGKVYYHTNGQPAQPFMYPALKTNEQQIRANIKKAMNNFIQDNAGG